MTSSRGSAVPEHPGAVRGDARPAPRRSAPGRGGTARCRPRRRRSRARCCARRTPRPPASCCRSWRPSVGGWAGFGPRRGRAATRARLRPGQRRPRRGRPAGGGAARSASRWSSVRSDRAARGRGAVRCPGPRLEQLAAVCGDFEARGVSVPGQGPLHRAQLLQRPDGGVHALHGDAGPPGQIAVGQLGSARQVPERAEMAQREPETRRARARTRRCSSRPAPMSISTAEDVITGAPVLVLGHRLILAGRSGRPPRPVVSVWLKVGSWSIPSTAGRRRDRSAAVGCTYSPRSSSSGRSPWPPACFPVTPGSLGDGERRAAGAVSNCCTGSAGSTPCSG